MTKPVVKEGSTRGPNPSEIRERDAREEQKKYLDKVEKAGKPSKKKIKKPEKKGTLNPKIKLKKPEKKGTLNPKSINSNTPMVNSSGQIVGYGPEKKMGGGKVKGYKKGGPITYRMTGGQVVDNSYD
jgi:hypothetical protein